MRRAPNLILSLLLCSPALAQPAGLNEGPVLPSERSPDLNGTWRTSDGAVVEFEGAYGRYELRGLGERPLVATVRGRVLTLVDEPAAPPVPAEAAPAEGAARLVNAVLERVGWREPPAPAPAVAPQPLNGTYRLDGVGVGMTATPTEALVLEGRPLGALERVDLVAEWGRELAEKGKHELESRAQRHYDRIDATGIGTHYGDHSSFNGYDRIKKAEWIAKNAKEGTTPPRPRQSSCIGWVLENVGAAYEATGRGARWKEIYRSVTSRGAKGTDLAKELEKDGWVAVYWNPDSRKPSDGSAEHSYTARQAKKGKPYYGIATDPSRLVIDYKPSHGSTTREDRSGYERLAEVPFWFGLARGGSHTFVGTGSTLSEFHWSEMPNSKHAIDNKPFDEFSWLSGVIMVPPGTWN